MPGRLCAVDFEGTKSGRPERIASTVKTREHPSIVAIVAAPADLQALRRPDSSLVFSSTMASRTLFLAFVYPNPYGSRRVSVRARRHAMVSTIRHTIARIASPHWKIVNANELKYVHD